MAYTHALSGRLYIDYYESDKVFLYKCVACECCCTWKWHCAKIGAKLGQYECIFRAKVIG